MGLAGGGRLVIILNGPKRAQIASGTMKEVRRHTNLEGLGAKGTFFATQLFVLAGDE